MTTFDFAPLFRSTVGFDRFARLVDSTLQAGTATPAYPPYNIEATDEDAYRITMAVAGFREDDLDVTIKENTLTVSGAKAKEDGEQRFLYQGIAARNFVQKFQLAEHVRVAGANLADGMLTVDLVREVPEAMKPRTIKIQDGAPESIVAKAKKLIEGKEEAA